jgi:AcrR family transcriptional regulator
MARKYDLKKRAEQQDDTRLRIVEATIQLHESVGANATISAIAELAGVERATVYRHFPDQRALFLSCTGHYNAQNPPPDPARWLQIDDPVERLQFALSEIYAYFHRTEKMSARTITDLPQVPILREVLAPMFAYWARVKDLLAEGWKIGSEADVLVAAIGHAVSFQTWQSLVREQGLDDDQAIALMVRLVRCATCPPLVDSA